MRDCTWLLALVLAHALAQATASKNEQPPQSKSERPALQSTPARSPSRTTQPCPAMSTGNVNPPLPAGLPVTDPLNPVSLSPFTASNAFSGEFLGLPIPDDEQLWGLSPVSPTMGTGGWDAKADAAAFADSALERDLKNAQVRNGQPTPPPYADQHTRESSSLDLDSASTRRRARECQTAAASLSPDLDELPHQERAKRAKFLERNRLAASKCRQKKKEHTQQLEFRYKEQSEKKERLVGEIARLRSEILSLKNEVLKHAQCGDEPIKLHLAQMVKKITDTDGPPPAPADPPMDIVENLPASPAKEIPTPTPPGGPAPASTALSFGFDDPMQLEPATVAAAEAFEQQLRRDSEATLVSEPPYAFSADDTFDDLINV
ncbi:Basic leucine zipper (bZIP) transcription factor atfB [Penicillium hispanicum]|uniref:Basic leucine zipper (bZIP) transcription factor atfB n=1 Tax=Penicillium hispanicum TaxID=1080232 RepID=UPI0025420DE3|nr:Basic leucine zipper (bZIP) transcription factor atfB [Penicillium hispanicum]KAJ5587446.1 Basic leucine zipper (bZIP) transcription factor atfB [Penicillium hispanicum]